MFNRLRAFCFIAIVFLHMTGAPDLVFSNKVVVSLSGKQIPVLYLPSDGVLLPYIQPVKTTNTPLPVIYIGFIKQSHHQQQLWQNEFSYDRHNDLTLNHPISIYKISLSAQTSDG